MGASFCCFSDGVVVGAHLCSRFAGHERMRGCVPACSRLQGLRKGQSAVRLSFTFDWARLCSEYTCTDKHRNLDHICGLCICKTATKAAEMEGKFKEGSAVGGSDRA